jgi:hypothetical protein
MVAEERSPFDEDLAGGCGIDLSEFDEDFAGAEAPSFEEVPDGRYVVSVERVNLVKSTGGNPMLKYDLLVQEGEQKGRHIFKNAIISKNSLPYLKKDLEICGVKLEKLSDLAGRLEELLDKRLEVNKRTRGEFVNVYFDRLVSTEGALAGEETPWS